MSSKSCQTSEIELFPQVITGFRGESESCQTSKMELFAKIVKTKSCLPFFQKPSSWMFDKVLDMLLIGFQS